MGDYQPLFMLLMEVLTLLLCVSSLLSLMPCVEIEKANQNIQPIEVHCDLIVSLYILNTPVLPTGMLAQLTPVLSILKETIVPSQRQRTVTHLH